MKNMKRKAAALFLVSIMLVSLCFSCAEKNNENDGTTENTSGNENPTSAETSEELPLTDGLEGYNFEGYEFKILNHDPLGMTWLTPNITAQEEIGETVNDAMYQRTRDVEERFNVTIKDIISETNLFDNARRLINAGDSTYDIMMPIDRDGLTLAQEGLIYGMNALPKVDLSKPWWDQGATKALSIDNQLYFTYGDFNLTAYDMTCLLMFNKQLLADLTLEDPYELVKSGKWTYDKFFEMMSSVPKDLDGDGSITVDDRFGIMSIDSEYWPNFWVGAGENTVKKDNNDIPYFAVPGNEKFYSIMESAFQNSTNNRIFIDIRQEGQNFSGEMAANLFKNNHALFYAAIVKKVSSCRDMETEFGLLPFPKATDEQKDYLSRCEGGNVSVVPITAQNLERTSVILEALAYESRKTVIPAYYEVALKGKYARDSESVEMLDIIFGNRAFDLGDTYWAIQIREIYSNGALAKKNNNLTSITEKNAGKIDKMILETVDKFKLLK